MGPLQHLNEAACLIENEGHHGGNLRNREMPSASCFPSHYIPKRHERYIKWNINFHINLEDAESCLDIIFDGIGVG